MDIGEVCRQLELLMLDGDGLPRDPGVALGPSLESTVKELVQFHHQEPVQPLVELAFRLPYSDGFKRYDEKFWLGIYRLDEAYTVSVLLDLCTDRKSIVKGMSVTVRVDLVGLGIIKKKKTY